MTLRYGRIVGMRVNYSIYGATDTGKYFSQEILRVSLTAERGLIHDSVVRGVMTDVELNAVRQHASADVAPELYEDHEGGSDERR